jgi:hypothetical protein
LKKIHLPKGFHIELFSSGTMFGRSMVRSKKTGNIYVGSFNFTGIQGNTVSSDVYAITVDESGPHPKAKKVYSVKEEAGESMFDNHSHR